MDDDATPQLEISPGDALSSTRVSAGLGRLRRVLESRGVRPASQSVLRTDRVAVPSRGAITARFRRLFF